jgi:splicing factor 3B subunit 3
MIITYTLYKQKDCFFFLIQNELGDVFKITFTLSETNRSELLNIELEYFDSLPPCVSICVSKKGFVFCAAEKGPQ